MDLAQWLAEAGFEQYALAFAENNIDFSVLEDLTDADLKELGVTSLGHRKRLLAAIVARRSQERPVAADESKERRQVTILFADLSGFTALSQRLDPEDLHTLVVRYTKLVDEIVVRYGGTVDKHIGDSVMALFGAPVAHDDDSLRAARAALDIHEALANVGDNAQQLQAHVGIASGEVVASLLSRGAATDYTALGDPVNLAARLVAAAARGETLISNSVYRSLRGRAICESEGETQFKGIQGLVRVWRLLRVSDETVVASRSPFVGRDAELKQVTLNIDTCKDGRTGQVVYVRGEAGIGKSRFVEEARRLAEAKGFSAHRALILDFGVSRGQDSIRTIVRNLLDVPANADVAERTSVSERSVASGLVAAEQTLVLRDLLDLPHTGEWAVLSDAMDNAARNRAKRALLMALMKDACTRQRVMLIVEDLHWADTDVLGSLAVIASSLAVVPGILLMTSRTEGDQLDGAWRASTRGVPIVTIDLGPLRRDEALSLARNLIESSEETAISCIERSDGNPFYLEQLLRHVEDGSKDTFPASIQSLVLAQMDRLSPHDRQALQAASVIGQRFDLPLLRHLANMGEYVCDSLIAHALVLPEYEDFLFAHALIQEGVYASLLHSRRRALHAAAASWFATRDTVLHAQHLDRAEDERAPRAYLDAATTQRAAYHADVALKLVNRGLEIVPDDVERHSFICLRGELQRDLGNVEASIESYRQAVAGAPDGMSLCRAQIGLANSLRFSDGLAEALALLDAAQPTAESHSLLADLASLHHLRGNILFSLGKIEGCREQHNLSLGFARRSALPEAEARALGGLGDATYALARMRTAAELFGQCLELSRQRGLGRIEVAHRPMLGFCRLYLNELRQADNDGVEAVRAATIVGQPRAELLGEMASVLASHELGAYDAMKAPLDRGLSLSRQLGARRFEAIFLDMCARFSLAGDRRAEAVKFRQEALAILREVGMQMNGATILGGLAQTAASDVERDYLLTEAEETLRQGAVGHSHLWFYRDAVETMLIAKDAARAMNYVTALEEFTRDERLPWSDIFIARGRALASALQKPVSDDLARELAAIRDAMVEVGLRAFLPLLEAELGK